MRGVFFDRMSAPATTLAAAEKIVTAIPYLGTPDPDGYVRCHEVVRVVHAVLRDKRLRVADGFYNENCAHSWIVAENGWVLDVYAIERLPQVQVVDERSHAKKSYVEDQRMFKTMRKQGPALNYPDPDLALVRRLVRATEENLKRGRTGEEDDERRRRLKSKIDKVFKIDEVRKRRPVLVRARGKPR